MSKRVGVELQRLDASRFEEAAKLIFESLDHWYQTRLNAPPFEGPAGIMKVFAEEYERLDPGCCVTGICQKTNRMAGLCFFHPRPSHLGLGIMVVHPDFYGDGVAKMILQEIISIAEADDLPIRLISSAMNLDSYSLYNRFGFVPQKIYQDLRFEVPESGMLADPPVCSARIREANLADLNQLAEFDQEMSGIDRRHDFRHFLDNSTGSWTCLLAENKSAEIQGYLVSINHPGCRMLGPGASRHEDVALALIHQQLDTVFRGQSPVLLTPADSTEIISAAYDWGARNVELHVTQIRGKSPSPSSPTNLIFPTFLPESG